MRRRPQPPRDRRLPTGDDGTALTEFAIIFPVFAFIFIWAQFFVDLGLVRLKADEAARFAAWEMTVHQPIGGVTTAVRDRFRDLASPATAAYQASNPIGVYSFTGPATINLSMNDRVDIPFSGSIPSPAAGGGGGLVDGALDAINRFANRAVSWILRQYGLNTQAGARVQRIEFTVPNKMIPDFRGVLSLLKSNTDRTANPPPRVTVTADSPTLLVDSWKAWASKYNESTGGTNIETSPYESYGSFPSRAGLPERVVAWRMQKASFFGYGRQLASVGRLFTYVGMPNPFNGDTFAGTLNRRDAGGPVAMLPGKVERRSWVPGAGQPVKRFGDSGSSAEATNETRDRSLAARGVGPDSPRFTVPHRLNTQRWRNEGGFSRDALHQVGRQNPYITMYQCRDVFYMGSTQGGGLSSRVSRTDMNFNTYQGRMYRGCNRTGW